MRDFYSVDPRMEPRTKQHKFKPPITTFSGRARTAYIGTVGDRRFVLLPKGDKWSNHSPVLEIRSFTDDLHDRIVYKATGN